MPCSFSAFSLNSMGGGIDIKYSLNWQILLTVQCTGVRFTCLTKPKPCEQKTCCKKSISWNTLIFTYTLGKRNNIALLVEPHGSKHFLQTQHFLYSSKLVSIGLTGCSGKCFQRFQVGLLKFLVSREDSVFILQCFRNNFLGISKMVYLFILQMQAYRALKFAASLTSEKLNEKNIWELISLM